MTHLGSDVAAYVDGQLSDSATRAAVTHLAGCDECAAAVRQQRLLKSRMSTVASPEPSADLIDTLSRLTAVPPEPASWWSRVRHATPVTVGIAFVGASMAVFAVAYVVGAVDHGDPVRPVVEEYAADFFGASSATAIATTYTTVAPEELDAQGWPCHESLGDLQRTQASYDRTDDVVAVTYTDGTQRIRLYEQPGRLDPTRLDGFTRQQIGGRTVWAAPGDPTIVTWDRDGIVFTIVTDVDPFRLEQAVTELPQHEEPTPWTRIGTGLDRMTSWAAA